MVEVDASGFSFSKVRRDIWRSYSPTQSVQPVSSIAHCPGLYPAEFCTCSRMKTAHSFWATCSSALSEQLAPVPYHIFFLRLSGIFCVSVCVNCLLSFPCVPMRRIWLHHFLSGTYTSWQVPPPPSGHLCYKLKIPILSILSLYDSCSIL